MDLSSSPPKSRPATSVEMDLQRQRSWADLPFLVVSEIMDRLTWAEDYVRFGAVCVPWRTAFLQDLPVNANKHCWLPFLLIPPSVERNSKKPKSGNHDRSSRRGANFAIVAHRPAAENRKKRKFQSSDKNKEDLREMHSLYSIARDKVCYFQVRVPHNRHCVGSSLGWLLTMKPKKYGIRKAKYHVQLQNPFLPNADIIHLPQLPFHNILAKEVPFMYIRKAVLSSPPDNKLNKNFILMAIMGWDSRLAFFNPATKHFCWTPVGDWDDRNDNDYGEERMAFSDVIYFTGTQQFLAVHFDSGAVYAIDVEDIEGEEGPHSFPKLTLVIPPIDDEDLAPRPLDRYYGFANRYIVELPSGDLLQLIKIVENAFGNPKSSRTKFEVYAFDSDLDHWVQVHDIGDFMVFIGGNSSMSRSASDFPNCKPNCIYFTIESDINLHDGSRCRPQDIGIYNLEDETFQSHSSLCSISLTAPIWLEPTPK